jgi:endonuclease/exonuclease/phosphatase family metal-dependent hydrolase
MAMSSIWGVRPYGAPAAIAGICTALLVFANCPPSDPVKLEFIVTTFNVQNIDETKPETNDRMRELARGLKARVPFWSLMAIQESRYRKIWTGIPELSVAYQEDQNIGCPPGFPKTAAQCLASYLGTSRVLTRRGNAVIAQNNWELLGEFHYQLEGESEVPTGGLIRTMTGSRMHHISSGQIVPFISVHTVPMSASLDRQERQVRRILSGARQLWQEDDLPPVLAGDFNCGGWNRRIRELIYEYFYEASQRPTVDLVFVGRPQRWVGSGGVILPVEPREGQPPSGQYDPGDLSDHLATWVRLRWDLSKEPRDVPMPPDEDMGGRGCRPSAK